MLNGRHDYAWSLLRWDYWRWHINENIYHLNLPDGNSAYALYNSMGFTEFDLLEPWIRAW